LNKTACISNVQLSAFDITNKYGYYSIKLEADLNDQVNELVALLSKKIADYRHGNTLKGGKLNKLKPQDTSSNLFNSLYTPKD
jgi:hypothetical protein